MAVWVVRAGRMGEGEDLALREQLAVIGWGELGNLSDASSRDEIERRLEETNQSAKPNTLKNWARQIWSFANHIQQDDLVVLPLKTASAIAIGRVRGKYQYRADHPAFAKHTLPVNWIRNDIPRAAFDQDILYSFGAFLTVCKIQRNNAEERIRSVVDGKRQPAPMSAIPDDDEVARLEGGEVDLQEQAQDQIRSRLSARFRGHNLARLVDAILKAQGYHTHLSSAGADGGVDIIAGRGPMGFDEPRLCVQVKSQDDQVDVKILRELQGAMRNFGSEQGLLVAWGGFKRTVIEESRRQFFQVRLWDSAAVIAAVTETYDRLPESIRAELPLKRIWALVPDDQ